MVHELLDHAVPLSRVLVLGTVLAVFHQPQLVAEAQDVGQLPQQVHAVALKALIPEQWLVRLLKHHIGLFLEEQEEMGVGAGLQQQGLHSCGSDVSDVCWKNSNIWCAGVQSSVPTAAMEI